MSAVVGLSDQWRWRHRALTWWRADMSKFASEQQSHSLSKSKGWAPLGVVTTWTADHYVLGFAFSQSLCKSTHRRDNSNFSSAPRVYIHMQKVHIRTLKILQSLSEFRGLWKHPNNPACTKSVFKVLKSDTTYGKRRKRCCCLVACPCYRHRNWESSMFP